MDNRYEVDRGFQDGEASSGFVASIRLDGQTLRDILAGLAHHRNFGAVLERNRALEATVEELTDLIRRETKDPWFPVNPLQVFRTVRARSRKRNPPWNAHTQTLTPEQYEKRLVQLADHLAAVIGQTHIQRGEDALLADDTALEMLRDLLIEFDETVIIRNASLKTFKRFWRHGFRMNDISG